MLEHAENLIEITLDISGESDPPRPTSVNAYSCSCCGYRSEKLWEGARSSFLHAHPVCTLCYLTGHLDSPTAAHGRLVYLPGVTVAQANHLQRRALISILGGSKEQRKDGLRVWRWMLMHAREVESAWGTARAVEFAHAMRRLPPQQRSQLQGRVTGCALILPPDVITDLSLLLPAGKSAGAALTSRSWERYIRSDLYAEPDSSC